MNGEPNPTLEQRGRPRNPKQRLVAKGLVLGLAAGGLLGYQFGNSGEKSVAPAGTVSVEEIKVFNEYSRTVEADVRTGLAKVKQSPQGKGYVWYSDNRDHPYVVGALEDVYDELGIYQQSLEKEGQIETFQLPEEEANSIGLVGVSELQASVRRFDITVDGQRFVLEERKFNLRNADNLVEPYIHFVATAK